MFCSDEAWYTLNGYVSSQNNRYWSTENPHDVHGVPVLDLKVGILCAVGARKTVQLVSFHETFSFEHNVKLILSPLFGVLTVEEKLHRHFMQDDATAHTTNRCEVEVDDIFSEQVII
jgi:hypothetical protein